MNKKIGGLCKNCNTDIKYISSGSCVKCTQIRTNKRSPEIGRRYQQSEKGKIRWKKYQKTDVYKSVQNRYKRKDYKNNSEKYKKWLKDNYKKHKETYMKNSLKRLYGLSLEEYNNMVEIQNGLCYICKRENSSKNKKLGVDHCHKTGKIRKILCDKCNMIIGLAEENIETMDKIINYLKEHKD